MAIHLTVAKTQKQIDDAIRVRHEVFVVEDGKFGGEAFPDGRMTDHFDAYPGVYNIVAYDGAEAIATIRLTRDAGGGVPAERHYDFKAFRRAIWNSFFQRCIDTPPGRVQELRDPVFASASMLAIRQPWRRRRDVIRAMYRIAAGVAHSCGVNYIMVVVRQSTAKMYERLGFRALADGFWSEEIGEHIVPLVATSGNFYRWAFGDIPQTPLGAFKDSYERLFLRSGETIYSEGDKATHAYIIASGDVRISRRRPDRAELTLSHLLPGEFFGELALVDDKRRSSDAVAMSSCELITLSRENFQREVDGKPEQFRTLLRIATGRIRQMEELVMLLAFAPNRERLEYALRLARLRTVPDRKNAGQCTSRGGPKDLALTAAVDEDSARRFLDLATEKGALVYSQKQIRFLR